MYLNEDGQIGPGGNLSRESESLEGHMLLHVFSTKDFPSSWGTTSELPNLPTQKSEVKKHLEKITLSRVILLAVRCLEGECMINKYCLRRAVIGKGLSLILELPDARILSCTGHRLLYLYKYVNMYIYVYIYT